ncbi:MAG TPA: helicase HerA-like domain-containing protein, partial [Verrucomicrobiae bacterium]|nr:helicase HerA-like domain-containing protein [Verrucomicrobiae bacterium]
GIGEALVTVLSPAGVPTPLAATRLLPPDSLMAALPDADLQARISSSPFVTKYGQTIDRESAYELITARLATAKAAAATAAAAAATAAGTQAVAAGAPPTTAGGLNPMTPAQQQREIARQAREMAAAQRAADKERAAAQRQARADARERDRMVQTGVRTAGRVLTSRAGQDLLRGVFGTLFGKR